MSFPLRFGIGTGNRRPLPEMVTIWQWLEALGFDTVWVVDHFFASDDEEAPYHEAWTLITALAMRTERVRFGVMVSGNTYRNPGLLTKMAITIDHASNGRLELGLGAGWWEREHRAYSFAFPSTAERIAMLEEAVQVIDSLMTQPRTTFHGTFYHFEDAPCWPKPIQQPRIPITIGAFKPRMLRLAARYADTWNTRAEPEEAASLAEAMRAAARAVGRDPATLRFSLYAWRPAFTSTEHFAQVAGAYLNAGFTDIIFPLPPEEQWPIVERCAREVIPQLREQAAQGRA